MNVIQKVLSWARTKIGCKYSQSNRYGSNTFDCSSFIYRAFEYVGVKLVHKDTGAKIDTSTTEVYAKGFNLIWPSNYGMIGKALPAPKGLLAALKLQPGDIIFYNHKNTGRGNKITHVAIYVGDGKIVHARNPQLGVRYDPISYMADGVCAVIRYREAGNIVATSEGWKKKDGKWYYEKDKRNLTGWHELKWSKGTSWFFFGADGVMRTGRIQDKGKTYYLDSKDGFMWKKRWLDGKYYLKADGSMATNAIILAAKDNNKGYYVGTDGAWDGRTLPVIKP